MATVEAAPPKIIETPQPTIVETPRQTIVDDGHIVLVGIRWETYEAILEDIGDRHVRMNYDGGILEIMSPAKRHEKGKRKIGRMIETMTLELDIEIDSGGATTFRRKIKEKGLEPDECYWIAHAPAVRDKDEIDLDVDPPPDLAIEAENTRTLVKRLPIYAGLGFPELWRYDGKKFRVLRLQADGTYAEKAESLSFPFLPMAEIARFLEEATGANETTWIRGFRAWIKETIAPRFRGAADAGEGA